MSKKIRSPRKPKSNTGIIATGIWFGFIKATDSQKVDWWKRTDERKHKKPKRKK